MNASNFIIDVSEENFEYEVLSYSQNTPVVVDFWASWCRPCTILSPILESLANEANGAFRLAKVDADQNPNLALRYGVRSLPTIKAFSGGQVVGELVGLQPVERLREFLGRLQPPSELSLSVEKAEGMLVLRQWNSAEEIFRHVLDEAPENPAALLGLSKALLAQGQPVEARFTIENFPASPQYKTAEVLRPLAEAMEGLEEDTLPDESDLDAAFRSSIRLASRGKLEPALDGLLDILRQDKRYRGGKPRQIFVAILELLPPDDLEVRSYRSELASVLF
jgi:putative thioredoxin